MSSAVGSFVHCCGCCVNNKCVLYVTVYQGSINKITLQIGAWNHLDVAAGQAMWVVDGLM